MPRCVVAAVDLGASSGRVVAGVVEDERVGLHTVHRFANVATERAEHLRWDVTRLFDEVLTGLATVAERWPDVSSIGIDTWGVDHGLLDADRRLIADPVSHRDGRTAAAIDEVHDAIAPDELFRINGLQHLPFTTLYQLAAERRGPAWGRAAHVVLLPDLLALWLTGELRAEVTNASTTGLLDARTRTWSAEILGRVELDPALLPELEEPGATRGTLRPAIARRLGMAPSTPVVTVGSHDTASAVVGTPLSGDDTAYVSSGTWSLVGLELAQALLTDAARAARFTNEAGVDGRTRFLRNVGGLWLLQESLRWWSDRGEPADLDRLLVEAAALGPPRTAADVAFDVDDEALIAPGDVPGRIRAAITAAGGVAPATPAELVRAVLSSLAAGYADTVRRAGASTGRGIDVIHVVGGGSRNGLLCQLTADAAGLPVVAGPVEATALGNVLVQARAAGALTGGLDELRAVVASSVTPTTFDPA